MNGHGKYKYVWCLSGEGNGNPLQCSCLENPRDGGAWWAVISGVVQSRTQLKWLSSSSSGCAYQFSSVSQYWPTLRPHRLQHARPPCPSPTPRVYTNSCPLSQWCHPTISSSVRPLLLLPSILPSIRVFSNESALRIRWPKYWSFSFNISPSNEHIGLISSRMDWLDPWQSKGLSRVFSNTTEGALRAIYSKSSVLPLWKGQRGSWTCQWRTETKTLVF